MLSDDGNHFFARPYSSIATIVLKVNLMTRDVVKKVERPFNEDLCSYILTQDSKGRLWTQLSLQTIDILNQDLESIQIIPLHYDLEIVEIAFDPFSEFTCLRTRNEIFVMDLANCSLEEA